MNNWQQEQSQKILSTYGVDIIKGRKSAEIGTKSKDGKHIKTFKGWEPIKSKESDDKINYSNILTSSVLKHINDSIHAAKADGVKNHKDVSLDYDRIVSLFADTLSSEQYKTFNWEKAEDVVYEKLKELF